MCVVYDELVLTHEYAHERVGNTYPREGEQISLLVHQGEHISPRAWLEISVRGNRKSGGTTEAQSGHSTFHFLLPVSTFHFVKTKAKTVEHTLKDAYLALTSNQRARYTGVSRLLIPGFQHLVLMCFVSLSEHSLCEH